MLAIQEMELTSVGAALEEVKQGHQRLEAECQKLCSTCSGKFSSILRRTFVLLLYLVMNQLFSSGLCVRALLDQEEKAAMN